MRDLTESEATDEADVSLAPERTALVVEIGGTHVAAAIVGERGTLLARHEQCYPTQASPAHVLGVARESMEESLRSALVAPETLCSFGITLPGTVRSKDGMCLFSPVLQWEDVQIGDPLGGFLGCPPLLINTVQAVGLGELHYGAGQDVDSFACVSIGTGIAGSLILSGRLHSGDSDSAGEIGHITVVPDGPECSCGNQGCLETLASGPAVSRMADESLKLGVQSILADWSQGDAPVSAEKVCQAAEQGDALAVKIWEKVGRYLGLGLSTLITLVNPRRIILGGRVSGAYPHFESTLREEVRRRARVVPRDFTEIVPSPLGTNAALLGTAAACFKNCGATGTSDPLRTFEAGLAATATQKAASEG